MYWKVGAVAAVLAFVMGWAANGWRLGQEMEKERVAAAEALVQETAKVLAAEQRATTQRNELEVENARINRRVEETLANNRRLVRELGGMRDPGRSEEACATLSGAPGRVAGGTAGARLSEAAEEFLLELAADADRAAAYAQTCHQWATLGRP